MVDLADLGVKHVNVEDLGGIAVDGIVNARLVFGIDDFHGDIVNVRCPISFGKPYPISCSLFFYQMESEGPTL